MSGLLDFLVPSKARQGLLDVLCRRHARASVSDLARRVGVTTTAAQKEVDQMLALGLAVSEREGRRKMVRSNDASPHARLVKMLLEQLDEDERRDDDEFPDE